MHTASPCLFFHFAIPFFCAGKKGENMKLTKAYLGSYIGSKDFYKSALLVMIPVIIQQLINTLFNVVDNMMVGQLDQLHLTAVSAANKPYLIFSGFIFGLTGGGIILISQYFGAGDRQECQNIFSLEMALCTAISLVFCVVLYFFPTFVMGIFLQDETTIALGAEYMRVVSFSYIPVAISSTCIFSLRALGKNKMPMIAGLMTMGANALFNYILIFGKLGFPAMGVTGAALGTLFSRLLEMCFYLVVLKKGNNFFTLRLFDFLKMRAAVVASYIKRALPLTLNEMLWTTGLNIYAWSYARLDEPAYPALVIAELTMQVGMVLSVGMASAISVMVGTELGANRLDAAKENCKRLLPMVCIIAIVSSFIGSIGAFVLPGVFAVEPALRTLATKLTLVFAMFYLPNALYSFCFFCLRAGGDTKSATLLDSGYMWMVPVPASILMAVFFTGKLSLLPAVFIVQLLMNAKVVWALAVLKKGKWMRNITITEPPAA